MVDIIFFGILSVIILGRLWQILGQRNNDNPATKQPKTPPSIEQDEEDSVVFLSNKKENDEEGFQNFKPAPDSLAGVLARIEEEDPDFNEKEFTIGAKEAFKMIVGSFALGKIKMVSPFLAPDVEAQFQAGVDARQQAGDILDHELKEIKDVVLLGAELKESVARLTVRFISYQKNSIINKNQPLKEREESKEQLEEIEDVWVFERDLKSNNPNWLLIETKS